MSECDLRGYLATALTNLTEDQRNEVFSCSDVIGGICEKFGLSLYQPRKHTDPIAHATASARNVYLTDRERVATSDIIIALCSHPSHGVGAENEIAFNANVPVL